MNATLCAVQRPLVIGLVNNMSLSAMPAAKTQFAGLLDATGYQTELVCFTMHTPHDGLCGHLPIAALADRAVDAIIVTGMEVTTSDLRDEWAWRGLTRLHDWCERESIPAIWSCLAAHAAVLHRDGISRQRLGAKLSGLFDCKRAYAHHRLTQDLPARWRFPHSRYNNLPAEIWPRAAIPFSRMAKRSAPISSPMRTRWRPCISKVIRNTRQAPCSMNF